MGKFLVDFNENYQIECRERKFYAKKKLDELPSPLPTLHTYTYPRVPMPPRVPIVDTFQYKSTYFPRHTFVSDTQEIIIQEKVDRNGKS